MPALSVTIITLNEEDRLARTLGSLPCADEIVVVDSGSDDMTCRVALDFGARVVDHRWEGYAAQKNFAASQAQHDWILSLDGDEELNPELQRAISEWKDPSPALSATGLPGVPTTWAAGFAIPAGTRLGSSASMTGGALAG